jgi:PAS domain S-box-containing protein
MDAGRVVIRPLYGACAIVVLGILGCAWFARTDWPGSGFLRLEVVPFVRIADGIGLCTLALLLASLAIFGRQVRRLKLALIHSQRVLENVVEGVVVLDEGRIVSVSGSIGRLFGYAPAELIGRSLDVLVPGGVPQSGKECVGRRKDGTDLHVELTVCAPPDGAASSPTTLLLRDITPSKKAHETLVTRETYLRMIVEQMPAILWTTDRQLQITSTLGAGLAAVNLKAKDVIGMSMLECLERDKPECTPITAHMKALRGESLSYEMEWKGRTFQVRVDPLRGVEKSITGTIGILVDVTDHKQAVAELKARHRQQAAVAGLGQHALEGVGLEALLSKAVTLISETLDVETCAVLESSPDSRSFTPRASLGDRSRTAWNREPVEQTIEKQAARALLSTEPVIVSGGQEPIAESRPVNGISTIIPGERRPFGVLTALTMRPHKFTPDDSHFIQAVAHILAAAIERKQAEEAQARLVAILEATTDVVAMTGTDRRLLYLNRAGRNLLGIGMHEDVSACRLSDLCAPARSRLLDESIARAICDGAWSGEMALVSRAGVEVPVSQVVLAHKSRAGAFEYLSTIARDTTEHQRLEEQLRQAQKMEAIGRLAGGIAHDFNNLLCIITGYTALVVGSLPPDDTAGEFLDEVAKAAERATALTQQLLAFSRKQMLVPRVLNLNTLLTDLDKMLRPLLGEDVELSLSLGAALHSIKADQNQIEQILMNLAVNARDAMPRGGRLSIATANVALDAESLRDSPEIAPGDYVCLEVSDTGCGMDREVLGHLFEPFFTTKEQGKGTGLGLATVFGIVKQSSGHIHVQSAPGQGTTFRIYLPRFHPSETAEAAAPSVPSAPRGGKETLLVVEDEDGLRSLAIHTLRQRGYHILEASDGEEALEVSRRYAKPIHLLVSDVVMPRLSGSDLAARLLVERPDLKVLFMSGFTDSALFRHGILSGEVECLLKPFAPKDLAEKVREVLDGTTPARVAV